tara:strand:+ start:252 stop:494 length:243 start_codon:yes stop_codon:yes gene_type:complete
MTEALVYGWIAEGFKILLGNICGCSSEVFPYLFYIPLHYPFGVVIIAIIRDEDIDRNYPCNLKREISENLISSCAKHPHH